ncbi:MAG: hypothetical protein CL840_08800 [Crocinitomicaceae bacterium]|nr:hypothetical protein [Crocinitomicaceae bacterium]|tara:strand:- start:57119 stop:57880 length:762 start_codon:yes stop_codon:yes gene_type:complete
MEVATSLVGNYVFKGEYYLGQHMIDSANHYLNLAQSYKAPNLSRSVQLTLEEFDIEMRLEQNVYDSVDAKNLQVYQDAQELGVLDHLARASELRYMYFEQVGNGLKALEFHRMYKLYDDSLKSVSMRKSTSREQAKLEYQRETIEKEQAEKLKIERRNGLEYSGISIGVFVLFGLVFLIGKYQLPKWLIELSIFLPFLILFEFLLVFTDPYVEAVTGGDPIYKLLINAGIGGIIFPLHAFFERTLKKRLFKHV